MRISINSLFTILFLVVQVDRICLAQDKYVNLEGKWKTTKGNKLVFPAEIKNQPVLFFFLSPECPLCINYSDVLSSIPEKYGDRIKVYGVFSGGFYTKNAINKYASTYKIPFPLLIDPQFNLASQLGAEITPECFLLDQNGFVQYRGAIDDRAPAPGKFKNQASANYLEEAIGAVLSGKTVPVNYTKAVGCFIYP
jgi:thiol-disulfide isomerase/thioredoxin